MLVPEYVLTTPFFVQSSGLTKELPAGSFVKPIEACYIPDFIKEKLKISDPETETYCYTAYGIILVPKNILRIR